MKICAVRQGFLAVRVEKPLQQCSDHHVTPNLSTESRTNAIILSGQTALLRWFLLTDVF